MVRLETGCNAYRLVTAGQVGQAEQSVEFAASGREAALVVSERIGSERPTEVFENGRSLGSVQYLGPGWWRLTPASA